MISVDDDSSMTTIPTHTISSTFDDDEIANDPLAFLRRGDTELVWFNRLIRNVCERWFNENL